MSNFEISSIGGTTMLIRLTKFMRNVPDLYVKSCNNIKTCRLKLDNYSRSLLTWVTIFINFILNYNSSYEWFYSKILFEIILKLQILGEKIPCRYITVKFIESDNRLEEFGDTHPEPNVDINAILFYGQRIPSHLC